MRTPSGSDAFGFWLCFRSVTGRCGHAPSLSLAKTPKSLAAAYLQPFFKRPAYFRKYPAFLKNAAAILALDMQIL
jgi:hypothetical protein